jgi:hypothetical protein
VAWLARATRSLHSGQVYLVVVDPLVGSRLSIASSWPTSSHYAPDVAYNGDDDQYLVTWLEKSETLFGSAPLTHVC